MDARIRVGVLLFSDGKLLLVKHVNPHTGFTWWVPPGGALEGDETIFEAARREAHEETGLQIVPHDPVYLRQFIFEEGGQNTMDVYVTGDIVDGSLTVENIHGKGHDEYFIRDVAYFTRAEMQEVVVFPKALQSRMWDDREQGFKQLVFLGIERDED